MIRTTVVYVDDLTQEVGAEPVLFGLDGKGYEMHLGKTNRDALDECLAPFIAAARVVKGGVKPRVPKDPAGVPPSKERNTQVREWCRANGVTVAVRGALSARVKAAYAAGDPALAA